jgi:hypothetical protein
LVVHCVLPQLSLWPAVAVMTAMIGMAPVRGDTAPPARQLR